MRVSRWKSLLFRSAAGVFAMGLLAAVATPQLRPAEDPPKKERPRQLVYEFPAVIEPFERVRVQARIVGYVQQMNVDIGDRVKKGQVLATLAVPEVEAKLAKAKAHVALADAGTQHAQQLLKEEAAAVAIVSAQLQQAEASVKHAQAQLLLRKAVHDRVKALVKTNSIDVKIFDEEAHRYEAARATVDEATAKVQVVKATREGAAVRRDTAETGITIARARQNIARADLQGVKAELDYARIVAPFDGVVTQRSVSPGDFAGPPQGRAMPLLTVERFDRVRVVFAVPDAAAPSLRVGTLASVQVDVLSDQTFKGKVSRTAGSLDKKRTLRVEIDLANPDGKLLPGMVGRVSLRLGRE